MLNSPGRGAKFQDIWLHSRQKGQADEDPPLREGCGDRRNDIGRLGAATQGRRYAVRGGPGDAVRGSCAIGALCCRSWFESLDHEREEAV